LVRQVDKLLVDIAPPPTFGRIIALDDRMAGRMEVGGRMPFGRLVTTPHMSALPADAKMHPPLSDLQAFLAATRAGRNLSH
jgi:hypothetical protein